MDKAAYFQYVYEAQFALGKKTGACLSAQYLALEVFLQRNDEWHSQWWPIVGISIHAWELLQQRAAQSGGNRMLSTQGIIRTHLHDRVARGRTLFERETPLPDAWHFHEARDATVLALIKERDQVHQLSWLPLDPSLFGQQGSGVPSMTRKRFDALARAIHQQAA